MQEPRVEREDRPERERPERPERPDRGRDRGPRPEREARPPMERPAFGAAPTRVDEAPAAPRPERAPRPATPAPAMPAAASIDLTGASLQWENEPARPAARQGMSFGRAPAIKSRTGGVAPPQTDPTRRSSVSESPASVPTAPAVSTVVPTATQTTFKVEAHVREVKGPLPGVDASRYRAAEAPASRFSSDTPTAWDEEPKEHD
jgi:hypothetical protein